MGTNTLPVAVDDNIIPAEHHNALVESLLQDFLPRNPSRVVTSDAGQLGSSLYRWLRLYVKEIFVGTTSESLKIYEGVSGEIWISNSGNDQIRIKDGSINFYIAGALKGTIDQYGIEGNDIKLESIVYDSIVPKQVTESPTTTGPVGSSLVEISTVTISHFMNNGRKYILNVSAEYLDFNASLLGNLRMNIKAPTPAEVQLRLINPPTPAGGTTTSVVAAGLNYDVMYTAAESGNHTLKIYGQRWNQVQNLRTTIREA